MASDDRPSPTTRPPRSGPSRRTFLGASAGLGIGAAVGLTLGGRTALTWCSGPVHPLARKTLRIDAGTLPANTALTIEWWLTAPDGSTQQLESAPLAPGTTEWTTQLSFNHPTIQAGTWEYIAVIRGDGFERRSDPLRYELRRFRFGA